MRRVVLLLLASFCARISLAAQIPVNDDPLTLFSKLMPVLAHDRCANCHGATDPFTGAFHPGQVSPTTACVSCHTAAPNWRTPQPIMAFFQKTTKQLCQHFAAFDPLNSNFLDLHLQTDDLIQLGFVGRRGGAVPAQFTAPPPMTKAEFITAFRTWVRRGSAACSGWEGTITRTETIANDSAQNVLHQGPLVSRGWQNVTRQLTITIRDATMSINTTVHGATNTQVVTTLSPTCESKVLATRMIELVGATNGTVTSANVRVRVGIRADGTYRIEVVPPPESTRMTNTTVHTAPCIPTTSTPTDYSTSDWDPWDFDIIGTLPNPRVRNVLQGSSDITMTTADADRPLAIAFYGDASKVDGSNVPFRVVTTWNLKRLP